MNKNLLILIAIPFLISCFPAPFEVRQGLFSEDGLWVVHEFDELRPQYAKGLRIYCIPPEQELTLAYRIEDDLCRNGTVTDAQSVKINGKEVFFQIREDTFGIDSRWGLESRLAKQRKLIHVPDEIFLNRVVKTVEIDGHEFEVKYNEGVMPNYKFGVFAIILGFFSLFLKRGRIWLEGVSISSAMLSFALFQFDRHGLCGGCYSPGFLLMGFFYLVFYAIIFSRHRHAKLTYVMMFLIFLVGSALIGTVCWNS